MQLQQPTTLHLLVLIWDGWKESASSLGPFLCKSVELCTHFIIYQVKTASLITNNSTLYLNKTHD